MDRLATIAALILRDGELCHLCGQGRAAFDPWEVDHKLPKKRGGDWYALENLGLAHRSCNRIKGASPIS